MVLSKYYLASAYNLFIQVSCSIWCHGFCFATFTEVIHCTTLIQLRTLVRPKYILMNQLYNFIHTSYFTSQIPWLIFPGIPRFSLNFQTLFKQTIKSFQIKFAEKHTRSTLSSLSSHFSACKRCCTSSQLRRGAINLDFLHVSERLNVRELLVFSQMSRFYCILAANHHAACRSRTTSRYGFLVYNIYSQQTLYTQVQGAPSNSTFSWLNIILAADYLNGSLFWQPIVNATCFDSLDLCLATWSLITKHRQLNGNKSELCSNTKITFYFTTLFPCFQDWYLDWKIDNSIGFRIACTQITFISMYPTKQDLNISLLTRIPAGIPPMDNTIKVHMLPTFEKIMIGFSSP